MMEIELQSFFHLIHNLNILTLRHPRLSQRNLTENIFIFTVCTLEDLLSPESDPKRPLGGCLHQREPPVLT